MDVIAQALPIVIGTAIVVGIARQFVPGLAYVGFWGPIMIVLGLFGWKLAGSSVIVLVGGIAVSAVRAWFTLKMQRD